MSLDGNKENKNEQPEPQDEDDRRGSNQWKNKRLKDTMALKDLKEAKEKMNPQKKKKLVKQMTPSLEIECQSSVENMLRIQGINVDRETTPQGLKLKVEFNTPTNILIESPSFNRFSPNAPIPMPETPALGPRLRDS